VNYAANTFLGLVIVWWPLMGCLHAEAKTWSNHEA